MPRLSWLVQTGRFVVRLTGELPQFCRQSTSIDASDSLCTVQHRCLVFHLFTYVAGVLQLEPRRYDILDDCALHLYTVDKKKSHRMISHYKRCQSSLLCVVLAFSGH